MAQEDEAKKALEEGRRLLEAGDLQGALQACERAIELKPGYPEAWYYKGVALGRLERYPEALQAYEKAIGLKPDYPEAWYGKGLVLYRLGKHQEARFAFERAPKLARAWYMKGVVLAESRRYRDAIEAYEEAIRQSHEKDLTALAWYNKGVALSRLGREDEAEGAWKTALFLGSRHAEGALTRGRPPHDWWQWWFSIPPSSCPRRVVGSVLLFFLVISLLWPLSSAGLFCLFNTGQHWTHYLFNTGQHWTHYVVPVAALVIILLWPSIRGIRVGGVAFDFDPPPEIMK